MIELRVLGSLDLRGPEGEALLSVLTQPKRAALLAYLAVATPRGFHRRDKLLGLFWAERDQEHARAALRTALYFLRQWLGEDAVPSRGDEEVGLAEALLWCDAVAFEEALEAGELEKALELYRGDLLEGFYVAEPEFERWLEGERSRLRRRAAEAAWALADREERKENGLEAAGWARRATAFTPDDEGALRRLVEFLDRVGDRAGAVKEYEVFVRRLKAEYEIEPSPETQALVASVRERAAAVAGGAPERPVEGRAGEAQAVTRALVSVSPPPEDHAEPPPVSLLRVFVTYGLVALAVLLAVHMFTLLLVSPNWFFASAVVVLLVCLPIIVATALVYGAAISNRRAGVEARSPSLARRWLTWRNAAASFASVLAVWGLIAAARAVLGGGFVLARGAAADFVGSQDTVVVAEFENETDRLALGLAIREAVAADLSQSDYVSVLGERRVRETLGLMHLPDTTRVGKELALEIARRQNCPAVVWGSVAPLGTGYLLSAVIVEVSTGEEVIRPSEIAADETEVVKAAQRLAHSVRRHLGESLPSIQRSEPLHRVTTSSLEALEFYSRGLRRWGTYGDTRGAIPLLEQAIALDTAFAAAYRTLSVLYANLGIGEAAGRYETLAYRFRERLSFKERLEMVAYRHAGGGRFDSAAHYWRVLANRYPHSGRARSNLGVNYQLMGRLDEAVDQYLEALKINPRGYVTLYNIPMLARAVGRHALADSVLAILHETWPESFIVRIATCGAAYYAGHIQLSDSLARAMADDSEPLVAGWGKLQRAGLASIYGRVNQAVELADTSAALLFEANSEHAWLALSLIEHASLAADVSERALPYLETFRSRLTLGTVPRKEHGWLGLIAYGYALARHVQPAHELLAAMDSLAETNDFHPTGIGERVLAVVALQEGRAEDAVIHLRRSQAAEFGHLRWEARALLADAQAALGHLEEAIAQYDTLTGTYRLDQTDLYASFPLRPLAHERLGSLYLQVGDTVAAARHLTEFTELWKDADPELQPRVESARRLLTRLVAREAR